MTCSNCGHGRHVHYSTRNAQRKAAARQGPTPRPACHQRSLEVPAGAPPSMGTLVYCKCRNFKS